MGDARLPPRVAAQFWIQLDGLESGPQLVFGAMSTTGVSFERSRPSGEVGVVERMSIADRDRKIHVRVLAQLVRTGVGKDLITGVSRPAVAFEFLPQSAEVATQL